MILSGVIAAIVNRAIPDLTEINPPWENVVFQMPMNTLLDQTRRHVVTANGNALVQSATTMLGFPCAYFDGAGDYLSTPYSTDFNPESGDYTIECFVIPSSVIASGNRRIMGFASSGGGNSLWIISQTATGYAVTWFNNTSHESIGGGSVVVGELAHLKVEKIGMTMNLYQNGVKVSTAARTTLSSHGELTQFCIGRMGDYNGQYFHGFIGGVRIAKGWASGQEAFLPPVSVFEPTGLIDIDANSSNPNVVLNTPLAFDYVDRTANHSYIKYGTIGVDYSKTLFGIPTLNMVAGSTLSISKHADFVPGVGDFTAECFIDPNMTLGAGEWCPVLGVHEVTGGVDWRLCLTPNGSGGLKAFANVYNGAAYGTAISVDDLIPSKFNHIAFVKKGTNFGVSLNGKTVWLPIGNGGNIIEYGSTYFIVGYQYIQNSSIKWFSGNIGQIRVSKGTCWYPGDTYITPSLPFAGNECNRISDPNFQNVVLAMPFDGENGLTTDLAGNPVTVNGTGLALDNYHAAFGSASEGDPYWNDVQCAMHMSGLPLTDLKGHAVTNTAVTVSNGVAVFNGASKLDVGAAADWTFMNNGSSYTIEGFVKQTSPATGSRVLASTMNGASNQVGMCLGLNNGTQLDFFVFNGVTSSWPLAVSFGYPADELEHHVAACFDGKTGRIFIDGKQVASADFIQANGFSSASPQYPLTFGATNNSAYFLSGEMREWVITRGISKYRNQFIPNKGAFYEYASADDSRCLSGSGNGWLTVPNSSKFTFTGDLTISSWVWGGDDKVLISNWRFGYAAECGFYLAIIAGVTYFSYGIGATNVALSNSQPLKAAAPNHIAVTRKDGVIRVFVNGVSNAPAAVAGTLNTNSLPKRIGGQSAEYDATISKLVGYMDDLFVCNGWAKWDSDFYPPMQKGVVQSLA